MRSRDRQSTPRAYAGFDRLYGEKIKEAARWARVRRNLYAERALRAVALGRENWLFAGSDDGGERAAAIYALIGTTKLDPETATLVN